MTGNPFNFGKPMRGKDFCNRRNEIESAIRRIKKLQYFSVVGERRIGKTSFLQHLLSKEVLEKHAIDPKKYIAVYLDAGSLLNPDKEIFIEAINKEIEKQIQTKVLAENVFEKLKMYVEKLASDGNNLIIALDEFEIIAPLLDSYFSSWLKSVFVGSNVVAITASRVEVNELVTGGKASPLFNIFGPFYLQLFSRTETENMLKKTFKNGEMKLEKEEISFLANLSGGNPYIIQYVGSYYYEERKNKGNNINYTEFENKMLNNLWKQFKSYLENLTEEEKDFLIHPGDIYHPIGSKLKEKGFLIEKNGKLKIFSNLFEKFLEREIQKETKKEIEKEVERGRKEVSRSEIASWIIIFLIIAYFLLKAIIGMIRSNESVYENMFLQIAALSLVILTMRSTNKAVLNINIMIERTRQILLEEIKKVCDAIDKL